jgi:hypothetical protein
MSATVEDPKPVVLPKVTPSKAVAKKNGNGHGVPAIPANDEQDFLLRVARDPAITAEKLRGVVDAHIALQEKQREWLREDQREQARIAFYTSRAPMQAKLPVLEKDTPNQEGKGKFTDFGDLWEACCPIWTGDGFTVSFDVVTLENGLLRVMLFLDHALGHREIYLSYDAPPDTTGPRGTVNKTLQQGSQATITYMQRGLLCRALGIGMKREEDDGNSGSRDDNPHRPHTKPTQQRETTEPTNKRPTVDWVDSSYRRLGTAKNSDDWMAMLSDILANAPSATETAQLAKELKDYVEKIPDRAIRGKVSAMFHDRMGALAPKSDTASDKGNGSSKSDTESDKHPPLTEDEQWAEDQISNLTLIWDMDSLLICANDPKTQARMQKLKASPDTLPIFERVKREFDARHAHILREAAR